MTRSEYLNFGLTDIIGYIFIAIIIYLLSAPSNYRKITKIEIIYLLVNICILFLCFHILHNIEFPLLEISHKMEPWFTKKICVDIISVSWCHNFNGFELGSLILVSFIEFHFLTSFIIGSTAFFEYLFPEYFRGYTTKIFTSYFTLKIFVFLSFSYQILKIYNNEIINIFVDILKFQFTFLDFIEKFIFLIAFLKLNFIIKVLFQKKCKDTYFPKMEIFLAVILILLLISFIILLFYSFYFPTDRMDFSKSWVEFSSCFINRSIILISIFFMFLKLILGVLISIIREKGSDLNRIIFQISERIISGSIISLFTTSFIWTNLPYFPDKCNKMSINNYPSIEPSLSFLKIFTPKMYQFPLVLDLLWATVVLAIFFIIDFSENASEFEQNIKTSFIHIILASVIVHQIDVLAIQNNNRFNSKIDVILENRTAIMFSNLVMVVCVEISKKSYLLEMIWVEVYQLID